MAPCTKSCSVEETQGHDLASTVHLPMFGSKLATSLCILTRI